METKNKGRVRKKEILKKEMNEVLFFVCVCFGRILTLSFLFYYASFP